MNTALCNAGYGLTVAVWASGLLRPHTSAGRAPRLAIAAWFLAATSALTAWTLAARAELLHHDLPGRLIALTAVAALTARLLWAWTVTVRTGRAHRARQRTGLSIVGRHDAALAITVVDCAEPLAYCLPGRDSTVVVTSGARQALSAREFRAVIAHERAHLSGRHNLTITLAHTLARAMPVLPLFAQIGTHVPQLLEMRADDVAARVHGRRTVAQALLAMSPRSTPAGALGAGGDAAQGRGLRLCQFEPAWRTWLGRAWIAATVVALATGPYVWSVLPPCPHPWW